MQETHKISCIFLLNYILLKNEFAMGVSSLYFTLHMPHCIFKITKEIKKKLPDLAENYYLRGKKGFFKIISFSLFFTNFTKMREESLA